MAFDGGKLLSSGSTRAAIAAIGMELAGAAGAAFAEHLESTINGAGMSPGATNVSLEGGISVGSVSNNGDDTFTVHVTLGEAYRPSLQPERYGGINDMAMLFNEGAEIGGDVWGYWHGDYIVNTKSIPAHYFMEQARDTFDGSPYNVVSITLDKG